VKVIVSQAQKKLGFKHVDFPAAGTLSDFKAHMKRHQHEAYHSKFSDFNLMVNLPRFFKSDKEIEMALEIAQHVGEASEFPKSLRERLDNFFVKHQLF